MEFKNIASTFSSKSDIILAGIMKKYNLGEPGDLAELILTKITMDLSRSGITEKEAVELAQKELKVSQQISGQIIEEVKTALVPTLWDKMPEQERLQLLSKKEELASMTDEKNPASFTKKTPDISVEENAKTMNRSRRPVLPNKEAEDTKLPKDKIPKAPERPKTSGPDQYREPIQ